MNVLVTGATGFVGRHVCERLQTMGWAVTALGRNAMVGAELKGRGIRFVQADLRHTEEVSRACEGQQVVIHSAALSSPWGAYREFYASNVDGTRHLLEASKQHGVQRFIHLSTPSVYFDYQHREGIRESDPLPARPVNAYAATKLQAEELVLQAGRGGMPVIVFRPRAIFGPGDTALFPRLLRANNTRGIPMIDGGLAKLDLTYVENLVDAIVLALSAPDAALGRVYNISNGEPVVLREVLSELLELLDMPLRGKHLPYAVVSGAAGLMELAYKTLRLKGEPLLTRYTVGVLTFDQTLDISEAVKRLGYQPRVSVAEGIRRYAAWWKEQEQR